MTAAFGRYAAWYDTFQRQKDYQAEVQYVLGRVTAFVPGPKRWLDIGCGTGRHLGMLQALGIEVEGLDVSADMIARARAAFPQIRFHVARAQDFVLNPGRDVVSMLFHVMSYQVSDVSIRSALDRVVAHLAPRGVLVFDFWNTAGVLREPPARRIREADIDGRQLFRISTPSDGAGRGRFDIRFEFRWDSPDGPVVHEEIHALRHFTDEELETLLHAAGLTVLSCDGWMHDRRLSDDWYGLICAGLRAAP